MLLLKHLLFYLLWFAQLPVFEVASVKPSRADMRVRSSMRGGPGTADAEQITFTNVTLMSVLARAYDVKNYQVTGPQWLSSERYDIAAKVAPGTTKEQFNLMLQNLVAERFHLALHHETKEFQGYELVVSRAGSKLKVSGESGPDQPEPTAAPQRDANGFPQLEGPGMLMMEGVKGRAVISYLTARSQSISALADRLSREFRMPIVDKTGLAGRFDFKLEYAPQAPGALTPDTTEEGAANLLTAVQQQLGLKLNPAKIPLDVLIIDRADKVPTQN
jgi:uncharacterized protein (TIGR03435 family)